MTVELTWLGHAAVQLEYEGTSVVIDPFFTGNPTFSEEWKPENIDLLLVTHGHNDHFGDTVELAKEFNPTIPVIHEMSVYLQDQGVDNAVGMNFGGTYEHESGIKVTLVPSSHSAGYQDDDGNVIYMGSPGGYVIHFPTGERFYHCGDTGVTADMQTIADLFQPTTGILAIGGHYTMDPKGAAYAAKLLGLKKVVPIHYGTFEVLTGTPTELEQELEDTDIVVIDLEPGQSAEF